MARPSAAAIAAAAAAKEAEIAERAQKMAMEMVPTIIATLTTQLAEKRAEIGAAPAPAGGQTASDRGLIEHLASAIVKAGDPKNVNRTLDPQIAAQRKQAHKDMIDLLITYRASNIVPTYKVRSNMWLNDTLIQPQWRDEGTKTFKDTVIRWDRTPNEGMIPVGEHADAVFALYKRSIGSVVIEGVPDAPWLNPAAPWVFSKEGIVQGRPMNVPEMPSDGANPFREADPRMPGQSSVPSVREIAVLGNSPSTPKVVETNGVL